MRIYGNLRNLRELFVEEFQADDADFAGNEGMGKYSLTHFKYFRLSEGVRF